MNRFTWNEGDVAVIRSLGDVAGHEFHGNQWTTGSGETAAHTRAERAIATHKPSTRVKQQVAARSVTQVAQVVKGTPTDDHQPMDVIVKTPKGTIGIEVKTLLDNSNDKITMHPESLARKDAWVRENKAQGHTIVVDKRGGRTAYYHREGFGSFRIASMTRVSGDQVRQLILGKRRTLAEGVVSYYLHDANGYVADGPSVRGLEDFAKRVSDPVVNAFLDHGYTKDIPSLIRALERTSLTASTETSRLALLSAARKAQDVLILTDGMTSDEVRTAGDVEGHPFHGNQWTTGTGGEKTTGHDPDKIAQEHGLDKAQVDAVHARILKEATTDAEREYSREMAVAEAMQLKDIANGDSKDRYTNPDGSYTAERVAVHDAIIKKFFDDHVEKHGALPPRDLKEPVVTFMAGMPGAGKSTSTRDLQDSPHVVTVDPDHMKSYLPKEDYRDGLGAAFVQRESGHLADRIMVQAADARMNIVLDGTLKSAGNTEAKIEDGALGKMAAFKDRGYRVEARFVDVDVNESIQNSVDRFGRHFRETGRGRYVPTSFTRSLADEKYGTLPRRSFEMAKATSFRGKPVIDAWTHVRGYTGDPKTSNKVIASEGTLTKGGGPSGNKR